MKKNVLILEDEKVQSKKIEMLINSVSEGICSYPVNTYSEAMKILDVTPISFFCIDIDLGNDSEKKDGLDFARYIRSKSEYEFTPIIYITSVSSRLEEALSTTHCYAYIKKPYSDEEIKETAKKMLRMPSAEPLKIDINGVNGIRIHMEINKIAFIESYKHDLVLHTEKGIQVTKSYSLKSIARLLPDYFIRCHNSYIINRRYISGYDMRNQIISLSGYSEKIPVGRKYHNTVLSLFYSKEKD